MLARTFKTHVELGLQKHEYDALVTVLYQIEDGQIPPDLIYMGVYTHYPQKGNCGTVHCLAGWAHEVDKNAFPEISSKKPIFANFLESNISTRMRPRLPHALQRLFWISGTKSRYPESEAPARLRTYLETGMCE